MPILVEKDGARVPASPAFLASVEQSIPKPVPETSSSFTRSSPGTCPHDDSTRPGNSLLIERGRMVPRIVGPLGVAPLIDNPPPLPPQGDPSNALIVGGVIALGLIGAILYAWYLVRRSKRLAVQLPSAYNMFARGISDDQWQLYLKKVVHEAKSDSLKVRKGRIYASGHKELPLLNRIMREHLLRLPAKEDRTFALAAWSRQYRTPTRLSDLPHTLAFFDEVALSLNPDFLIGATPPLLASVPEVVSHEFIELVTGMVHSNQLIPELVDIYEPALLANYFRLRGHDEKALVMLKLFTGHEDVISTEDVAQLFVEIRDMQSYVHGGDGISFPSPQDETDIELYLATSMVHMYLARTLADNVRNTHAVGVARWHVLAVDKLLGARYAADLDAVVGRIKERKPALQQIEPPPLKAPTASWKINLAQMTLQQLKLRLRA